MSEICHHKEKRYETRAHHNQPDPYDPFLLSQGMRIGDLLFISGQAGYADDGSIVKGGFRVQGEQAFANLQRALTPAAPA